MKILVDEMPSHPMDCPHAEIDGDMEYQWWHCNYGDCGCKITKDCPFFMSFEDYKNRTANRGFRSTIAVYDDAKDPINET